MVFVVVMEAIVFVEVVVLVDVKTRSVIIMGVPIIPGLIAR